MVTDICKCSSRLFYNAAKTHFIEVDCDQSMVSEFLWSRFHFHCVIAGSVKGEHLGGCGLAEVGAVTHLG